MCRWRPELSLGVIFCYFLHYGILIQKKKSSLNMDFTNLKTNRPGSPKAAPASSYSSLESQERVIIPAFLRGCQASRFRSLCFHRKHVTNQAILPAHGTDFPYRTLGIRTCLLWGPEQLLCKNFNLFSFRLWRLVSSDKRVSPSLPRRFFCWCYPFQTDITLAVVQIV